MAYWVGVLQDFNFSIAHIPGTTNVLADALSRVYPQIWGIPAISKSVVEIDVDGGVSGVMGSTAPNAHSLFIIKKQQRKNKNNSKNSLNKSQAEKAEVDIVNQDMQIEDKTPSKAQEALIAPIVTTEKIVSAALLDREEFDEKSVESNMEANMYGNREDINDIYQSSKYDLTKEQSEIIDSFHKLGHFGTKAMVAQLKLHNHKWKNMALHVQELISNCKTCQRWNQAKRVYTQLKAIHANLPWDHVQMDLITSFPCTEDG